MLLIMMLPVPLLVALLLVVPGIRHHRLSGAAFYGLTLLIALVAAVAFDYGRPERMRFGVDGEWAPAIGLRFHLGVDGVSLPLVVLTALLTFLCFLYTLRHSPTT